MALSTRLKRSARGFDSFSQLAESDLGDINSADMDQDKDMQNTLPKCKSNRKLPKRKANNVYSYSETVFHNSPTKSVEEADHLEEMFKSLHELQKEGRFCDVLLKSKEGVVSAHRVILMAAIPQFYESIEKGNNDSDNDTKCIDVSHIPHWAVEDIVSYIYSGKLQLMQTKFKEFTKFCKCLGLHKLCKRLNPKINLTSGTEEQSQLQKSKNDGCTDKTEPDREVIQDNMSVQSEDHSAETRSSAKVVNGKVDKTSKTVRKVKSNQADHKKRKTEKNVDNISLVNEKQESKEPDQFDDIVNDKKHVESSNQRLIAYSYKKHDDSCVTNANKTKKGRKSKDCYLVKESKRKKKKTSMQIDVSEEALSQHNKCDIEQEDNKIEVSAEVMPSVQTDASLNDESNSSHSIKKSKNLNDSQSSSSSDDDNDTVESQELSGDSNSNDETDSEYKPQVKKVKYSDSSHKEKINPKRISNKTSKDSISETRCKRCEENFETHEDLKKHRKTCKGNRPRKRCILCKISFTTAEEYVHHRKTDEKCLEIQRQKHQRRLNRKAQLRARFACRVCPRKFRRVADHIDHEFVAHELPYDKDKWPDLFCEYCNYWTMNPWRLHHHKTYDCSKGQEYICDVCGNKYKNEKTLKCHKEMQHTDALPMIACEQCGKTLKGPKGLQHHIRIMHKGENPHKRHMCHICSMKYTSNNDLTFHLHKVHSQPLPEGFTIYQCGECDYMINNKRTYQKHMLLHEDKRDFRCEMCPKAFKTKNSLHTHMKSHNGKKMPCPYDGCNYGALKKCHLKTHIENQHTQKGVKNEECHICSYSTFFKGNLIKHLRTVHQLEVVTRYSVQMKAKYKHLKTGDIVGTVDQPEPPKIKKKPEQKNPDTVSKPKMSKHVSETGIVGVSDGQYGSTVCMTQHHKKGDEEMPSGKFEQEITQPSQIIAPIQQNVETNLVTQNTSHSYMYPMNNVHIPNNPASINNVNLLYGNPQDLPGSQQGVGMSMTLPETGGTLREVNLSMQPVYGNKVPGGVVAPVMYHPQAPDDEVTNAAKMLTYFQM